jgi:MYXO-CTERM domain-containing protein
MKRLTSAALALTLLLGGGSWAVAQETSADSRAERAPIADDRDSHDNWGWVGLLGLAGLAGLKRRRDTDPVVGSTTRGT